MKEKPAFSFPGGLMLLLILASIVTAISPPTPRPRRASSTLRSVTQCSASTIRPLARWQASPTAACGANGLNATGT